MNEAVYFFPPFLPGFFLPPFFLAAIVSHPPPKSELGISFRLLPLIVEQTCGIDNASRAPAWNGGS
jgi:hypothetical protein